jgi:hypothetical protein
MNRVNGIPARPLTLYRSATEVTGATMSLIPCPACGKQVSKQAPTCPQCGQPIATPPPAAPPQKIVVEQPKSGGFGVGGCLVLLLLIGGAVLFLTQTEAGKRLFNDGAKVVNVAVTDEQRIQGKWKGSPSSLEFFSDGKFKEYAALATHDGKWQMLDGKRLKLIMDSQWMPDSEWRYEIDGDKLTLTDMRGNVKLEFQRDK